ncbi:MAG: hypothetical protein MHM6MM_000457 [Cercozoa sp. M6MM]
MSDWGDDGGNEGWGDENAGGDENWGNEGAGDDWENAGEVGWEEGGGEWDEQAQSEKPMEQEASPRIQIDNLFYEGSDLARDEPEAALERLLECVRLEEEHLGNEILMRFDALERIVVLYLRLRRLPLMREALQKLLSLAERVTPNSRNKAISTVLDTLQEPQYRDDAELLQDTYKLVLDRLETMEGQERAWFATATKLAKTYYARGNAQSCEQWAEKLHAACRKADGSDDPAQAQQLLEVYALKLQLLTDRIESRADDMRDEAKEDEDEDFDAKLRELFQRTRDLSRQVSVTDPRNMSIINECWGKAYAQQADWRQAFVHFWEAFLQYQQVGGSRTKAVLQYVVLANMAAGQDTNPLDAREAKAYANDPHVQAMAQLRRAYDERNVRQLQRVLRKHRAHFDSEPFMRRHLSTLLWRIRSQALAGLVASYTRVRLQYLADYLNTRKAEVHEMLVQLILDGEVRGRIDEIEDILLLGEQESDARSYRGLEAWAQQLDYITLTLAKRTLLDMATTSGRRDPVHSSMDTGHIAGDANYY